MKSPMIIMSIAVINSRTRVKKERNMSVINDSLFFSIVFLI